MNGLRLLYTQGGRLVNRPPWVSASVVDGARPVDGSSVLGVEGAATA